MNDAGRSTILDRLAGHAARTPHRTALCLYAGETFSVFSYGDLQARALRWGERLARAAGPQGSGQVAFIMLAHGIDLYAAFLGAMAAGLVPSMLPPPQVRQDPSAWAQAQGEVIARSGAVAIVSSEADRATLGPAVERLAALAPEPFRPASSDFRPIAASPEGPALLQHSSGTTGLKKGVVLSFGQVDRHAGMVAQALGAGPAEVIASWLPLYHDMGLMAAFLLPLTLGAGVVALDSFAWVAEPMSLLRAVERHRATLAWLPNFAFAHLARTRGVHPAVDLSSLRALIDCSEPCRAPTLDGFLDAFADCRIAPEALACCYGMAEVVFAATQTRPGARPRSLALDADALDGSERRAGPAKPGDRTRTLLSCGPPLPGVELRIDAPRGCAGEILVRSPTSMSGYHGQSDEGALPGGWRRSGDVGLLDGGELFVCGRIKEMLIVRGRNLYAGDVEALVSGLAGVKPGRAVALAWPDEAAGTDELAIMLEPQGAPDAPTLQARVREAVHGAFGASPRHVVVAAPGTLAKSTAGKMSRADNLARLLALLADEPPAAASLGAHSRPPTPSPRDGLAQVAGAMHECFGVDPARITLATRADDVPGWDSLGHTILLLRLEALAGRRFGESAAEARTAGELALLLSPTPARMAA